MDDQTLLNVVHVKKWAGSWVWVMQIKLIFLIYSLMLMDITSDLTVGLSLKFFFEDFKGLVSDKIKILKGSDIQKTFL
jgi:hypothetical protein